MYIYMCVYTLTRTYTHLYAHAYIDVCMHADHIDIVSCGIVKTIVLMSRDSKHQQSCKSIKCCCFRWTTPVGTYICFLII